MGKLNVLRSDLLGQIGDRVNEFDHRWGGPDHDSKHSMVAWRAILSKPLARLDTAIATKDRPEFFRALVRIAAVAMTAWSRFGADPDGVTGGQQRRA